MDFYFVSAGLIPLLMFVDLSSQAVDVNVRVRLGSAKLLLQHEAGLKQFGWAMFLFWWLFFGWAEWICLRSLEIGHAATGGATVIWVALAFLTVQAAVTALRPKPVIRGTGPKSPSD